MGYRRLFIMRKDLNMSPGKLSAQVAHCAEAYWAKLITQYALPITKRSLKEWDAPLQEDDGEIIAYDVEFYVDADTYKEYIKGCFTKTVCEAKNKNHLLKATTKAQGLGLIENEDYGLIYDACFTELTPEEPNGTTLTGIWFKPLPDDVAHEISKKYQLYK